MPFDVIGDIHGQYDKLVALLESLGYQERGGVRRCAERTAIFVGDLIDRGPLQLATLDLVRRMLDVGSARCIMGNHEFNAIAWATADPAQDGEFLRRHTPGNFNQHRAFLEQLATPAQYTEFVAWFKTLPLWLDLGGLRIVHACWHQPSMAMLRPTMGANETLTDELLLLGSQRGEPAFEAIEIVLKGPEVALPQGVYFDDKEGKRRTEVRVRWWQKDLSTYRKAAIGPPGEMDRIPDVALPPAWTGFSYAGPPVIFGHYWFTGNPTVISDQFACVDYSAAADGPLVAYRWDGESTLSSKKLIWAK